jgi:hypothetical protein
MAPTAQKLDPLVLSLINAPVDDEPTTEEDLRAIAQADEDFRQGRCISHEDLMRELGIEPGTGS